MQQQSSSAVSPHHISPPPSSLRSPSSQSPLPLTPLTTHISNSHREALPPPPSDHVAGPVAPVAAAQSAADSAVAMACPLARVRLSDIAPYDGAPGGSYVRAVEALSGSLMRYNAAVIELENEAAALARCGLEAARLFFKSRAQSGGKGRGVYMYRAGRLLAYTLFLLYQLFSSHFQAR